MFILSLSLIIFIFLLNIIYIITPVSFKYLVSPIMIPLYLSICQKYYQDKKDKELLDYKNSIEKEIEFYKSKLTGYTLVTKLQFELEFSIYKEIYSDIMQLYLEIEYKNKEELQILKNRFDTKILEHMPYIQDEIFHHIGELSILIKQHLKSDEDTPILIIAEEIHKLSKLIKERINKMKIIE
ncbi:MAG: hypothetical protein ACRC5S_03865 [Cetobacterium sp.]